MPAFDIGTIAIGLVLFGLCLLAAGYRFIRTIIRELPTVRRSWRALSALIIIAASGYLLFVVYLATHDASLHTLILSLVFATGASFVFIIGRVSRDSIGEAQRLVLLTEEHSVTSSDRLRLQTILDNAAEGIITFNDKGHIELCNRAAEALLGYRQPYLQGREISDFITSLGSETLPVLKASDEFNEYIDDLAGEEVELLARDADSLNVAISARFSRILIGSKHMYTALVSDIRDRQNMLDRLRTMAERDTTTNLFNRSYFQSQLEQAMALCNTHRAMSLLCIDLDNFKMVNDVLGHAAGDILLIDVARVLEDQLDNRCLIARYGGDEFTVLVKNVAKEQVTELAEDLRQSFENYLFSHDGREVDIGCSIGVAYIAESGFSADDLLDRADTACQLAKQAGRNQVHLFHADDQSDPDLKRLDLGWSKRIKQAIEEDRLVLAGQPIVLPAALTSGLSNARSSYLPFEDAQALKHDSPSIYPHKRSVMSVSANWLSKNLHALALSLQP